MPPKTPKNARPVWRCSVSLSAILAAGALLCISGSAKAQEALTHAYSASASEAVARASNEAKPPNFRVGPVDLRVSAGIEVEFNDNINVSQTQKESDLIIRPTLGLNASWKLTGENTLKLDLGIGYGYYLNHSEFNTNSLLVSPNSALQFNLFIAGVRLNFHDRFSVQQDPVQQSSVSNTSNFGSVENTIGVQADWKLSSMIYTVGYDHYTYISTGSGFDYLNHSAEILTARAAFGITPTISTGLEGTATFTTYDQNTLSNNTNVQIGPFVSFVLTHYLNFQISAGYQGTYFDSTAASTLTQSPTDQNSYYARFIVTNRLNAFVTQSLSFGHQTELGTSSDTVSITYARYSAGLKLLNGIGFSFDASYEHGNENGGLFVEKYNQYGAGFSLHYKLTPRVDASMAYTYYNKESNLALRSYSQNRVIFGLEYRF